MSGATEPSLENERLEALLTTLEKTIAELAGGTAPLEELVTAHQRAVRLLALAQARVEELKERALATTRTLEGPASSGAAQ